MNNTIPNVPRELEPCPFCGSEAGRATKKATWNLSRHRVACTNSGCGAHYGYWHPIEWNTRAPSPAGADGLEVIGWYTDDHLDDKSATTYSREVADRWLAKGWPVTGIANAADATAIIDGLRGEVAKINSDRLACWAEFKVMTRACLDAEKERDHQAQRIGELEGLLRDCYPGCGLTARQTQSIRERIDAAMSAGKERE